MDGNNEIDVDELNDNWEVRRQPHPFNRVYLRFIAVVACLYLIAINWVDYYSEPMIAIRCMINPDEHKDCNQLEKPTYVEISAAVLQFCLYTIAPAMSFIGQLHHLLIYFFPSAWKLLPKNFFCNLHHICFFSLYRELIIAICESTACLTWINASNPMDPTYSDTTVGSYVRTSIRAIFNFLLFLQFPIYAHMTVYEERHARVRRQLRHERRN